MALANDFGYSTAMSSSFSALNSTVEDRYHKLPNSFWGSSGQELMNNPVPCQVFSAVSAHGRTFQTHPPVSTMPSDRLAMQSSLINHHPQEFSDPLEEFFDFSDHASAPNPQADGSEVRVVSSMDEKSEWKTWADQLMSVDNGSEPNWSELLGDPPSPHHPNSQVQFHQRSHDLQQMQTSSSDEPRQEMIANQQHQVASLEEQFSGRNSSSASAATSKQRMRWTPELHEAFVEAVNQLGEPQEKKITSIEDNKSLDMKTSVEITQALKLQMEVQKRLHEQLEIQRSLQLQIEKQGRYLQMMFEKQQQLQENKSSSSEPLPKQCNVTSAEVEFGLETQAVKQTESALASRKRGRDVETNR